MNKSARIQMNASLHKPNPLPLTQDPLAQFQTFAMNFVLYFKAIFCSVAHTVDSNDPSVL